MAVEFVPLLEAADLAGITPKHMRRVIHEARSGFRVWWKGQRLEWRGDAAATEVAVRSLPQEAREAYLIRHYHLNLALPEVGGANSTGI